MYWFIIIITFTLFILLPCWLFQQIEIEVMSFMLNYFIMIMKLCLIFLCYCLNQHEIQSQLYYQVGNRITYEELDLVLFGA